MTKFAIFMYLCAAAPNLDCRLIQTEFNSFKDEYECVRYGYEHSLELIEKFGREDKTTIEDAKGYHKSLFTAMNADAIARHFYEQGKADAIKTQVAKDKNINTDPRQTHGETEVSGVKYKVLGDSTSDFKFKINKRK